MKYQSPIISILILIVCSVLANGQPRPAGAGDVFSGNRTPNQIAVPRGLSQAEMTELAKLTAVTITNAMIDDYTTVGEFKDKAQRTPAGAISPQINYTSDFNGDGSATVRAFHNGETVLTIEYEAPRKHNEGADYPVTYKTHWTMAGEKTDFIVTFDDSEGSKFHLGIFRDKQQNRFNMDLEFEDGVANGSYAFTGTTGEQISGEVKNASVKRLTPPKQD